MKRSLFVPQLQRRSLSLHHCPSHVPRLAPPLLQLLCHRKRTRNRTTCLIHGVCIGLTSLLSHQYFSTLHVLPCHCPQGKDLNVRNRCASYQSLYRQEIKP